MTTPFTQKNCFKSLMVLTSTVEGKFTADGNAEVKDMLQVFKGAHVKGRLTVLEKTNILGPLEVKGDADIGGGIVYEGKFQCFFCRLSLIYVFSFELFSSAWRRQIPKYMAN